jgi:hypothetical protein
MAQSVRWIDNNDSDTCGVRPPIRLSFIKFLKRYPIFYLAYGPPIFRSGGIDATKGVIDAWTILQVGLLFLIVIRAIRRLSVAESILIPKQIRSILRNAFLLGALFLVSAVYSPSRLVSAAYSILYLFTWICVAEFIVDIYRKPPNWLQSLFHLRMITLQLFAVILMVLPFKPGFVMGYQAGVGMRLGGGSIGFVPVICPIIAIISAYAFVYSLESKGRSFAYFLIGLVGTLVTQSRGSELALLLSLAILVLGRAKTSKRAAYKAISWFMALILLSGVILVSGGGGRIWNTFNRGQEAGSIESASGRTDIWKYVIQYCVAHPQGMGYVAGFRMLFREYSALGLQVVTARIGNPHNSFLEVLADAGWLALAIYLIMITEVVAVGWSFVKKQRHMARMATSSTTRHAVRCGLLLLVFCFGMGMSNADFCVPLRGTFYLQNIIIAIILGACANMIVASRAQHNSSTKSCLSEMDNNFAATL